jgi:16S rRNA (guanine966-N2)-methyltransferase
MRIISGKHKGRKLLDCHKLKDLRPTTSSNKESLFNILASSKFLKEIEFDLTKCDLLDVFSGSGAVSFEALSRGARSATFIDSNPLHISLSKKNSEILGEERNCQFIEFDLLKPIFQSDKYYNLIFIDPPYSQDLIKTSLENLLENNFIKEKALIIIEQGARDKLDLTSLKQIKLLERKKYSKSIFTFFTVT